MSKSITLEYYGVEASGKTVREAKENAGRKIQQMVKGSYTPTLLHYRQCAIIIYRTPNYWIYSIISDKEGFRQNGPIHCTSGSDASEENVITSAKAHLAQNVWEPSDHDDVPPFLKDRHSVSDYLTWVRFQLRHIIGRSIGLKDNAAYNYAHCNPCTPGLWEGKSFGWIPSREEIKQALAKIKAMKEN